MRRSEIRQIGDCRYKVTQLKVRAAHRVLIKLIKVVGEPLGRAVDGLGETDPAKAIMGDLSKGQVGEVARALCNQLGEDDLNWVVDQFQPSVEFQTPELAASKPDTFVPLGDWDNHFAGQIWTEFKLLGFCLELNYADFFEGLGGLKGAVQKFTTPSESK